jgi:hypothetical protein
MNLKKKSLYQIKTLEKQLFRLFIAMTDGQSKKSGIINNQGHPSKKSIWVKWG